MTTSDLRPEPGAAAIAAMRQGLDDIDNQVELMRSLLTQTDRIVAAMRRRIDTLEAGLRPPAAPAVATAEQQQLIEAYLSGQVSAAQWEAHKAADPALEGLHRSYVVSSWGA